MFTLVFSRKYSTIINKVPKYYNSRNERLAEFRKIYLDKTISLVKDSKINSLEEWKSFRECVLNDELNKNFLNVHSFESTFMNICTTGKKFDLVRKCLEFSQQENGELKLATLGRYLKALYLKNLEKLEDEDEILALCQDIRTKYKVLDSYTLENVGAALSLTKDWKQCLELRTEISKTAVPNTLFYGALIAAAFRNKEEELAWNLFKESLENNREPTSVCGISYINSIINSKNSKNIEKLLTFYAENDLRVDKELADKICEYFMKNQCSVTTTQIDYSGKCKNCTSPLSKIQLTSDEFTELRSAFMENVMIGRDIFTKSTPDELVHFKDFLSKMQPFDVVLDGLNIAYSAGQRKPSDLYASLLSVVVNHFANQNKRVLVLGRVHMTRWPRRHWDEIKAKATIFLTQNISQDDPYLLYCALSSGQKTIVVSKDLMRGHKFLLKNRRHKMMFDRWLNQRQYLLIRVNKKNVPIFEVPLPYSEVPQKLDGIWHVPFITQLDKESLYKTWLCINKK